MDILTVKAGRYRADYSVHPSRRIRGPRVCLPDYWQQDYHSCGFLATLCVVHYYYPAISAKEVLATVRPKKRHGVDGYRLISSLEKLSVSVAICQDLTLASLREYVSLGIPVILSVWPSTWETDHWVIVEGFDNNRDRIYLTNYKSLSIDAFIDQWSDFDMRSQGGSREGLICTGR